MMPAFLYALIGGMAYIFFLIIKFFGIRILGLSRMEPQVKEELAETVLFTLLVAILAGIGDLTNILASFYLGGFSFTEIPSHVATTFLNAYSQLFALYNQAEGTYLSQVSNAGFSFGIFQVDLTSIFQKEPNYKEIARAQFLMNAVLMLMDCVSLALSAVQYLQDVFPYLLGLGVMLRCFKYTTAWGAAILGLVISFYFVYPAILFGFSFSLPPQIGVYRYCQFNIGGHFSVVQENFNVQMYGVQEIQSLLASIMSSFVLTQLLALSVSLTSAFFIMQVLSRGVITWIQGMRFFYYL